MKLDEFESIDARSQDFKVSSAQFARLAQQAISAGLINFCAPYWVGEEKKYLVETMFPAKRPVEIMSEAEAKAYLKGLMRMYMFQQKQNV